MSDFNFYASSSALRVQKQENTVSSRAYTRYQSIDGLVGWLGGFGGARKRAHVFTSSSAFNSGVSTLNK